jgi:hypothetical protein
MYYRILADATIVVHLIFIAFVLLGGVFVVRWRFLSMVHIPAVLWAVWVEYQGWICPLTPLENWFRQQAGMGEYQRSFVDQYLVPVLYPAALNWQWQMVLGTFVLLLNVTIYSWVWHRRKRGNH